MVDILDPKPTNPALAIAIRAGQLFRLVADVSNYYWYYRQNGGIWQSIGGPAETIVWTAPLANTIVHRTTFDQVDVALGSTSSSASVDTNTIRKFNLCEGPVASQWVTSSARNPALEGAPATPDEWEGDDPPLGTPLAMPGANRDGFASMQPSRVSSSGGPANAATSLGPGVSVDTSGNLSVRLPGAPVRGLGPFLDFANHYHTGAYFQFDLHGKSRTNGLMRVLYKDGSTVAVIRGDGRRNTYRYNGATWDAAASLGTTLTVVDGKFVETTPTGRTYHYASTSEGRVRLDKIADRYGTAAYYDYDGNDLLQKIHGLSGADALGLAPYFIYNGDNRVSGLVLESASPAQNRTTYFAYASGNLQRIIGPELCTHDFEYDGNSRLSAISDSEGFRWYFAYDASGRTYFVQDANQNYTLFTYDPVMGHRDRTAKTTYFLSNAWGGPVAVFNVGTPADYYTWSGDGDLLKTKNRLGDEWTFQYDPRGNRISATDPLGARSYFAFDGQDLLRTYVDPLGHATYLDYDANRNVTAIVDPRNKSTYFGYQTAGWMPTAGLLHYRKDRRGNFTYWHFDSRQNLESVVDALGNSTDFEFNDAGERIKLIDARSNETYWGYDRVGRVVKQSDPYMSSRFVSYDGRCNVVSETDERGNATLSYFDGNSNRVRSARDMGGGRYLATYFHYDLEDRLAQQVDPNGNATTFTYDVLGRRQKQTDALGNETYWAYDAAHQVERVLAPARAGGGERATTYFAYDRVGRSQQTIDSGMLLSYHAYDLHGRTTHTNVDQGWGGQPWGSSPYGGRRATTYFGYDENDRRLRVTDPLGRHSYWEYDFEGNVTRTLDARGTPTDFTFDVLNRQTHVQDAYSGITYTGYDEVSNVVKRVDPLGATTYFTFDKKNRLETTKGPRGVMGSVLGFTYHAYDATSNRVELRVENPEGSADRRSTYFEYDAANRVIRTLDPPATVSATVGFTYMDYDPAGNVKMRVDQEGRPTYFTFDALNRESTRLNANLDTWTTHYDGRGSITKRIDPEGRTSYFAYDLAGRTRRQGNALGEGTYFFHDAKGLTTNVINPRGYRSTTKHDILDRVTHQTDALGGVRYFAYDEVGNRTLSVEPTNHMGVAAPTYVTFDGMNRASTVKDISDTINVTYMGYDARSKLVKRVDAEGRTTYLEYDAAGRNLVQSYRNPVESADATVTYTFDSVGNMKTVQDATGTYAFNYDSLNRVIEEQSVTGSVSHQYDKSGLRTKLTSPDAVSGSYFAFDPAGRLAAVQTFDPLEIRRTYYKYDMSGMVTRAALPSNAILSYFDYDKAGRLSQKVDKQSDASTIISYWAYQRNANGLIEKVVYEAGSYGYYAYDALDRVTLEQRISSGNAMIYGFYYEYDGASNRTKKFNAVASGTSPNFKTTYFSYDERNLLDEDVQK